MASSSSQITALIEEDTTSTSSADMNELKETGAPSPAIGLHLETHKDMISNSSTDMGELNVATTSTPPPASIKSYLEANYEAIRNGSISLYHCLLTFAETNQQTQAEFFRGILPKLNPNAHLNQIFREGIFTYFSSISTAYEDKILSSKLLYIKQAVNELRAKYFINLINQEAFTDEDEDEDKDKDENKNNHVYGWICLFNFFKKTSFRSHVEKEEAIREYVTFDDLTELISYNGKNYMFQITGTSKIIEELEKINVECLKVNDFNNGRERLNHFNFEPYLCTEDLEYVNQQLTLFQQKHDAFMTDNSSVAQILQMLTNPSITPGSSASVISTDTSTLHLHYHEKLNQLLLNLIQPLTQAQTSTPSASTGESVLPLININITSQGDKFSPRTNEYLFINTVFIETLFNQYSNCVNLLNQFVYQDIAPELLNEFRQCFYQHLAICFPHLDNTIKSLPALKPTIPTIISNAMPSPPVIPVLNLSNLSAATTSPQSPRKSPSFASKLFTKLSSPRSGNEPENARKSTSTPSFSASSPIAIPTIETHRPKSEPASSSTFTPSAQVSSIAITMMLVPHKGLSIFVGHRPPSPRKSYGFNAWCEKFITLCRPTTFDAASRSRLEVLLVKFIQSKGIHMGDYKNLKIYISKVNIPDIFYRFDLELAHFTICNLMRLPPTIVYSSSSSAYPPISSSADMSSPRLGASPLILLPSHSPPSVEPPISLPPSLSPKSKP